MPTPKPLTRSQARRLPKEATVEEVQGEAMDKSVILQKGKDKNIEKNDGNSSVNHHINNGDQYGSTLLRKSKTSKHNTLRHKSYNRRKQAFNE